jgi:hypothetical protein
MLPMLAQDKANHLAYGALIACTVASACAAFGLSSEISAGAAIVATCAVAVGKELADRRNPERNAEAADIVATLAGAGLVALPALVRAVVV